MFFYIFFLRPPPLQAPTHGGISITLQISNDLRTEIFNGVQDLYYSWALECPLGQPGVITKPTKLTTWRPSSAYKEIPVPVPPGAREGQRWRLILAGDAQAFGRLNPENVDLRDPQVGKVPFPVMSMPVLFRSRGAKGAGKQEMIERVYLAPFHSWCGMEGNASGKSNVAALRLTEETSYDLDKKVWDSGIGLSSWLCDLKGNSALIETSTVLQSLRSILFSEERCRILELGAGIGIVSITLAALRSDPGLNSGGQGDDSILATDVSSAMPLLNQNILANTEFYVSVTPKAAVLDWDDEELPIEVNNLGGLDVIIMADVSYNTTSFPALTQTLSRLIRLYSKPPQIILGYKERDKAERIFWDTAARIGIEFEKIDLRTGAGGAPVEIWIGHVHK